MAGGLGGLASATAAARFLEGLALMRAAQTLSARNTAFGRQLLWTARARRRGHVDPECRGRARDRRAGSRGILSVLQTERIAAHTVKINTAASYFVLFIPVLAGLGSGRRGPDRGHH